MKFIIQIVSIIGVMFIPIKTSAQWLKIANFDAINVSANDDYVIAGEYEADIYLSTDNGTNWSTVGLNATGHCSFAFKGTHIYAGTEDGLFLSTNSGVSWTEIELDSNFYFHKITAIGIDGETIFAATVSGVYRSTNNGLSWISTGLTGGVNTFAFSGENIFAGTGYSNVFLSIDNGTNWTAVNNGLPQSFYVYALAFDGDYLFAGTGYYAYVTANNGVSWDTANTNLFFITAFALSDTNFFAGSFGGGVYLTQNNGIDWTQVGWSHWLVWNISVNNTYIFMAGGIDGVYRALLTDVTPVEKIESITTTYSLSQNYPNPFNPVTSIQYTISSRQFVTIKVYDILGKEVATLANEEKTAGSYEVQFDGSGLTSGIYFYQLKAGNYSATKKMILLR